jgi:hypothetical protein
VVWSPADRQIFLILFSLVASLCDESGSDSLRFQPGRALQLATGCEFTPEISGRNKTEELPVVAERPTEAWAPSWAGWAGLDS